LASGKNVEFRDGRETNDVLRMTSMGTTDPTRSIGVRARMPDFEHVEMRSHAGRGAMSKASMATMNPGPFEQWVRETAQEAAISQAAPNSSPPSETRFPSGA
jgi:hypothetical protein